MASVEKSPLHVNEKLVRRFPEMPRKPLITVRPKTPRPCIWARIARAEREHAGAAQ